MSDEIVEIEGVWIRESDNAILFSVDDGDDTWIPKTLVHDCSVAYPEEGQFVCLQIEEWFAIKRDLI